MFSRIKNSLKKTKQWVGLRFNLTASNNYGSLPKGVARTPQPIATYINYNQRRIVAQSRQLLLKNDYGRGALRLVQQNVVGANGLRFQANVRTSKGVLDASLNKALESAWAEWANAENCTLDGKASWADFQRETINSLVSDGEFFIRLHEDEDSKFRLKLQLLDAQRCSPVETSRPKAKDPTALQNGIVFDKKTNKPLTYLFSDEWSNDQYYDDHSTPNRYDRIPADEMLHGFMSEQTLQRRGLPPLHASLDRLIRLDQYEEAGLESAKVGAQSMGFLTHTDDSVPEADFDLSEHPLKTENGSFNELPPGLDIKAYDPTYPHELFVPFVQRMLHAIAVGFGVAYASLSGDVADANFSSLRHAMLGERGNWKMMQEWYIKKAAMPIYKRWLVYQLRNGTIKLRGRKLSLSDYKACLDVSWTPVRWEWIDPRNESIAKSQDLKNLTTSPSEIIREMGKDPIQVFAQIGEDIENMRESGIPEDIILDTFSNQINQVKVEEPDAETKPKKKSTGQGGNRE